MVVRNVPFPAINHTPNSSAVQAISYVTIPQPSREQIHSYDDICYAFGERDKYLKKRDNITFAIFSL